MHKENQVISINNCGGLITNSKALRREATITHMKIVTNGMSIILVGILLSTKTLLLREGDGSHPIFDTGTSKIKNKQKLFKLELSRAYK
jgi:hypothetical protein